MQDLAGGDVYDLRLVVAEKETEDTLEDVGQLLVLVRVLRDDTTLFEVDMRQHQPLRGDEAPFQVWLEPLLRQVRPAVQGCAGTVHDFSPLVCSGGPVEPLFYIGSHGSSARDASLGSALCRADAR